LIQLSKRDIQAQSLVDFLQAPLQPYIDNLDGEIYDIFEADLVKYNEYEYALISALETFTENKIIVCYYVGSGKGLILAKLMSASKKTGRKVKVYCIEKNPYPIQTLKRRIQRNKWTKFV
jgi:protein arginine N-methyltransferase 5